VRIIIDTNVIVSALISEHGVPALLLNAWTENVFELVTSTTQIGELSAVTRRPIVRPLLTPSTAGRFINDLQRFGTVLGRLPSVERSRDPGDDFLLAMAEASKADYLVTGDKRDLLVLKRHGNTRIVTARSLLTALGLAK
jgi:putative PIN family toxin of toxin-antitoxin system